MTSLITAVVTVCQHALPLRLRNDLEHQLYHQPIFPVEQCDVGCISLSSYRQLNCIPLAARVGRAGAASASPASPLYPLTLRRYLSDSGPSENDEYSAEYQSPLSLLIWKHILSACYTSLWSRYQQHERLISHRKKCKGSWICIGPYIAPHFEKLAYEGQVTLTIPAFTS